MLTESPALITNYGSIAPMQSVDNDSFSIKEFVSHKANVAAQVQAQQASQLAATMEAGYGMEPGKSGSGIGLDPSKPQRQPFDPYTIDHEALAYEQSLLDGYNGDIATRKQEMQMYKDLADKYGKTGDAYGDGSSNPVDFTGIPDDQKSFLKTLANVESGGKNITTPNKSGYVGIYQFRYRDGDEGSMWAKKFGVTPQQMINSPELQQKAMSSALKRYDMQLNKSGIPVNNYTRWLRHNQGLGGARSIVSGKLTNTIRRNIRNQGISGNSDYELIQNYHKKFKPRFS